MDDNRSKDAGDNPAASGTHASPQRVGPRPAARVESAGHDLLIGIVSGTIGGVVSSVLVSLAILAGSTYLALVSENQGGFIVRDIAPQVQVVPAAVFGRLPFTRSGQPLQAAELRQLHSRLHYAQCTGDSIDATKYLFQAFACQEAAGQSDPANCLTRTNQATAPPRQRVVFFYDGRYLGTDAKCSDYATRILDRASDSIAVEYTIYHCLPVARAACLYQSTEGTQIVDFRLSEDKRAMIPENPLPPVAMPTRDGR